MKFEGRLNFGSHCPWCSTWNGREGSLIYHSDGPCPYVKMLEFYPDGLLKSVTFKDETDIEYIQSEDEV